ncbi:hypothetical protein BG011_007390 [Mortierella polycephala]|uniref:Uncharacterized protein n=1 Tax=Mortierella polycephala TaxID=41804 RepID=A0A9P6PTI9_9FUNG|nr:hypothetical protein BG011_007390 [Mortierella polycephala]
MWKRSLRPVQLISNVRHSRNPSCCHQFRQIAWRQISEPRAMTVRNAWNWSKIKPDPKNPFFAQRSTRHTRHTAAVLLRNADIPMLQIRPPVFMPTTSDQVQHSLNILLFMSDFNNEPRPLAFNVLACSSTGLIHYIQIANQHLSLILPTYKITNSGRNPELIPSLLKTFLESSAYAKLGFGAYEDAARVKDQYGIVCKNVLDIHWMAKVTGIGSTSVGMLHDVFGEVHDVYIPGRIDLDGNLNKQDQQQQQQGQLIDPRRWDWESHGSVELSRELVRCIAQDAFVSLGMYDNIRGQKFKPGYQPLLTDPQRASIMARDYLLTNVPRGTLLPVRSIHHLVKGPFMSPDINNVDRDAQALALVRILIETQELVADKSDMTPFSFHDPSVLSRKVALPGTRSSEAILANNQTRKIVAEFFGCRADELRLMQDSDRSRKPDKIQDLECFLGVYEWLEFLPGAEVDETQQERSLQQQQRGSIDGCGRKESTLLALFTNFGAVAELTKERPAETKQWVIQRIERLVRQGALIRVGGQQGLIRINPSLLRQLKRIEPKAAFNKSFRAK